MTSLKIYAFPAEGGESIKHSIKKLSESIFHNMIGVFRRKADYKNENIQRENKDHDRFR